MIKLIIGAVVCAVVGLVVFMSIDPKVNTTDTVTDTTNNNSNTFSVTVEGEVEKTGTYKLNEDATMADLIEAAGGLTPTADDCAFFLDAELEKGQTYFIASRYDASDICNLTELTKVNINSDSADTILSISGFTTSVANSIVSYRSEHGQFNTIEDLLNVYGIGNATYRKVRNYVILHE